MMIIDGDHGQGGGSCSTYVLMAENEQQLSPEEKLLKVIQEGGDEAGDPAGRSPSDADAPFNAESPDLAETMGVGVADVQGEEEPVVPSPEELSEKPRLKVARPASTEGADQVAAGVAGVAGVAVAERPGAEEAAPVSRARSLLKKRPDPVQSISAVNKCLVVALLLLVVVTGVEIWGNVKTFGAERYDEGILPVLGAGGADQPRPAPAATKLGSLDMVLKPFMARSLFDIPKKPGAGDGKPAPVPGPNISSQLTLIGLTNINGDRHKAEAIVMDNKINKMHLLRIGDTVTVDGRVFTLEEIHPDHVVFTEGKNRITVECVK